MSGKQSEKADVLARLANMLCTAACLAWWAIGSSIVARGAQDNSAITVNGRAPAQQETPFACSLEKTLTREQRAHKKQVMQKMEAARIDTREIADGYVFRFRPEAVSFTEIADWVATERICCPFFDLAIESERENGPLSLRITGRDGVKQFIRAGLLLLKLQ
jgi:hypothetical protein